MTEVLSLVDPTIFHDLATFTDSLALWQTTLEDQHNLPWPVTMIPRAGVWLRPASLCCGNSQGLPPPFYSRAGNGPEKANHSEPVPG